MGKKNNFYNSGSIEDIIKRAFKDGDLSQLQDLGPAAKKTFDTFVFGSRDIDFDARKTPQSNTYKNTQKGNGYPNQTPQYSYPSAQPKPVQTAPSYPSLVSNKQLKKRIPRGIPQIILGSAGTLLFAILAMVFLAVSMFELEPISTIGRVFAGASGVITVASGACLVSGIRKYKLADRITQIANLLQQKKVYTFAELAAKTGRSPKQIKNDLRKARSKGLLPEIHTDADENYAMWGEDTYEQFMLSEKNRMQKLQEEEDRRLRLENPETADIERFRNEGNVIIKKIRAANDALPGEEISAKLDVLEDNVSRIVSYVTRHPEKLPETRKLMNYYLPTTLKLVEKYHQYDKMDFEPQNVRQTKAEIERSMDTINKAFENFLESLFSHDTLDVSTDIVVLEKMLEQEGLTGNKFKIDKAETTSAPKAP